MSFDSEEYRKRQHEALAELVKLSNSGPPPPQDNQSHLNGPPTKFPGVPRIDPTEKALSIFQAFMNDRTTWKGTIRELVGQLSALDSTMPSVKRSSFSKKLGTLTGFKVTHRRTSMERFIIIEKDVDSDIESVYRTIMGQRQA